MWVEWLVELGYALMWLFAQPVLYVAIILSFLIGNKRIKKDRKQFGHRVFPFHAEWKGTWLIGLIFGVIVSAGIVLTGLFMTWEWLIVWSAAIILLMLVGQVALLSPVYTLGLTILAVWSIGLFDIQVINESFTNGLLQVDLMGMIYLMLVLLFAEAILIATTNRHRSFPRLHKGDRGKDVGSHQVTRLMIVPLLIPLPIGSLTLTDQLAWWPVFGLDGAGMSFIIFPYIIGFSQNFRGLFSEQGAKRVALTLTPLTLLLLGATVGAYNTLYLGMVIVGIALIMRPVIHLFIRYFDVERRPIFRPEQDGITIVGIVPGSPADQMELYVGEKIERVHDIPVQNEFEFFDVMTENRTYCKLSVRDFRGETRFVQRPIYEHEDHELGLVFVKETPRFTLETETFELDYSS
ncbi:PDZ domain-containing protein [Alkalibacillus haloalkaliphilus]|uniref:Membrane protein n=1 Tax=Alkalibacillus haloalkaliphilus TaxID=94136 RepID=A0A511WAQ7_9BACI|nr:hypothetical protein [Alkalibacillus haloalkaliphilus]GEN47183.1 membrane protein [Alkalibacillus haloalkaliphilus]